MGLKKEIDKYLNSDPLRFHTPLHKGRDFYINQITAGFDVTEVSTFDNIHHQTGVILEIAKKCEEIFSAKKCFLSTSGTTLCNLVMMRAVAKLGKVAILRSCHKSIYDGAEMFCSSGVLFVDDFEEWKTLGTASVEKIREALLDGAKAVVVTSPSYYGKGANLEKIRKLCGEFGAVLAIDEAHGTHGYFLSGVGEYQLARDFADIYSGSFHKTLPCGTGGAILCVNNQSLVADCEKGYSMLCSTSPYYPCLLAIEHCVSSLEEFSRKCASWEEERKVLLENLVGAGINAYFLCDKQKLICEFKSAGRAVEILEELGIYPEFADFSRVVFLLNFLDTKEDYDRLFAGLCKASMQCGGGSEVSGILQSAEFAPIRAVDYFYVGKTERIPLENAVGRISAQNFGLYPPCFYLVTKGEVISGEILKLYSSGADFFGVEKGEVVVFAGSI